MQSLKVDLSTAAPVATSKISRRYKAISTSLVNGLAIRPDHGSSWDYNPGVYDNRLTALDLSALKAQLSSTPPSVCAPNPVRAVGSHLNRINQIGLASATREETSHDGVWFKVSISCVSVIVV